MQLADATRVSGELTLERGTGSIEWLVDNAVAYRALLAAIARAERSIWITQLAFDADCRVYDETCVSSADMGAPLLLDALADASRRGVAVRIVLNETLLLDTATPLRKAIAASGATNIAVRGLHHFPQLLHAKMCIVDEDEAIVAGSPFVNGYWDHSGHAPSDARRPTRELGGRPLHDLSMRVTGATVDALGQVFAELWNDATIGAPDAARVEPRGCDSGDDACLRLTRTVAHGVLARHPDGLMEIVSGVERAIAKARRFIYIEHQYLSSERVITALAQALAREPALEVVIVLNQNPDVTAYRVWQRTRLRSAGLLDHPRVGIFALWSARPSMHDGCEWDVSQIFVHSKVLIVDDAWLTAGSANLDGVSLHSYGADFTSRIGERVFRDVRNYDVNLELTVHDDDSLLALRTLRDVLWREHLGPDVDVERVSLALWRAHAHECVDALRHEPEFDLGGAPHTTMVLPYSTEATPGAQLRALGIKVDERIDLLFDPGWLEVHCSPNWIRNMFA
ncbi:MAG: phospholipase D-like domain-containing protein [Gemmatimonadaceae bacterium]